tara:strand:+ start:4407 stop:4868 length:462 start_codon:yes stop_codon:yes gene_type:complete
MASKKSQFKYMISIYTDGACSGNPGIGGWGAVIINGDQEPFYLSGGEQNTTNNRMELMAAINAIIYFQDKQNLEIFTDSKYLKDGIESWINKWKINGWKTSTKKPVKNQDLWLKLDSEIKHHNIKWNWVKGHANNKYNEKADLLARKYIEENI